MTRQDGMGRSAGRGFRLRLIDSLGTARAAGPLHARRMELRPVNALSNGLLASRTMAPRRPDLGINAVAQIHCSGPSP